MRVIVDTNVLIRAVMRDDDRQARAADKILEAATTIAVAVPSLCEFVWVLRKVYAIAPGDVAAAMRALLDASKVVTDRGAADAGLAILEAGGDFADGVIAHEGRWLGGETFVSFDKKAVALLAEQGLAARLL